MHIFHNNLPGFYLCRIQLYSFILLYFSYWHLSQHAILYICELVYFCNFKKGDEEIVYRTYRKRNLSGRQLKRIQVLKSESIHAEQEVCVERARYITEAYKEHEAEPPIKKRAYAFKNILNKINLFIEGRQPRRLLKSRLYFSGILCKLDF